MNRILTLRENINLEFSTAPADLVVQPCLSQSSVGKVLKAYFATKIETSRRFTEQPYLVEEKDTHAKVHAKVKRVDLNHLRSCKLIPGEIVMLRIRKKAKLVSFRPVSEGKIGEKVCIVVETAGLMGCPVTMQVLGSHNNTFVAPGEEVCLMSQGSETNLLSTNVGNWPGATIYSNAEDFRNHAVVEIELMPLALVEKKHWAAMIYRSSQKRAYLHLKIVASGADRIEYAGDGPGLCSQQTDYGIYLDMAGSWFQLYCCHCFRRLDQQAFQRLFGIETEYVFGHDIMRSHPNTYKTKIADFLEALENCLETYEINNCARRAHILGQIWLETDVFRSLEEYASGKAYNPAARKDAAENGNTIAGDGPKYKGRGCMQLTWKNAYILYQDFIRRYPDYATADLVEDFAKISNDLFLAVDSAGWFWRYGKLKRDGTPINFNRLADLKMVDTISTYVNGGGNGKPERRVITGKLLSEFNADLCPNIH